MATMHWARFFARPTLAIAAILAFSLAGIGNAEAQATNACGPRAAMMKHLAAEFHEQTSAVGVSENGSAVYEILTSADGETWTLLYSLPSGLSCLIATGQHWQALPHVAALGPGA